jgi:hypothetical protein
MVFSLVSIHYFTSGKELVLRHSIGSKLLFNTGRLSMSCLVLGSKFSCFSSACLTFVNRNSYIAFVISIHHVDAGELFIETWIKTPQLILGKPATFVDREGSLLAFVK